MVLVDWPLVVLFAVIGLSGWLFVVTCFTLWRNRHQQTKRKIWLAVLALPIQLMCVVGLLAGSLLGLLGFASGKRPPVYSPDRSLAARVEFTGPLASSGEIVYIYSMSGVWREAALIESYSDEPQLTWRNNHTLVIEYSAEGDGIECHNTAHVNVQCVQASSTGLGN
jgi:hypothetical protein